MQIQQNLVLKNNPTQLRIRIQVLMNVLKNKNEAWIYAQNEVELNRLWHVVK